MSTDQYSEPGGDDTGAVPQQAPKAEWPKKIRTLTAAELDRLTIDSVGRFYWDGQLVNYQPPHSAQTPATEAPHQPADLDALALLDRAARELSGQPPTDTSATAHPAPPAEPGSHHSVEAPAVEMRQPDKAPPAGTAVATVPDVPQVASMTILDMPRRAQNEKVRVRMSFLQSLALLLVVLAVLIGAVGVAVSGLVTAYDWGCRTNLVKQYCPPPPPVPKPPPRSDIPA